ncbi:hypothetical protein [Agromyces archimandritae]|uniref:Transcriptional regulator, AbiEi antitoxin, Type IV TA system n=1 Tax=Agromyces archimandritae TaxID=2781962 RepID=A0A975IML5_9MICO|nr:hypothetical protein [Agromyces archimandritae]QTX03637.1 hypothetical protein G127AT_09820 [Agromyces archimandritae]
MTDYAAKTASDLIRFRDVDALGERHQLYTELERGTIERVRHGVYVRRISGPGWHVAAERYRCRVLAASLVMPDAVFTGFSAAALEGLPIFGAWPREIHLLANDAQGHRRGDLVRIGLPKVVDPGGDVVDGCRTTSIEFTLIQLCRRSTLAAGVVAVDAAVHIDRHGGVPPRTTLSRLRDMHAALLPYAGSRRVEAVLQRAREHSGSVLESVDRLAFEELGFEEPELQHELYLPEFGMSAFLDFYWRSVNVGGEADGRGKYFMTGVDADSVAAAVIDEKDRENAIRRRLNDFDRWDWSDSLALGPLEARLVRMGVPRIRGRSGVRLVPDPKAPAVRGVATRKR